MLVLASASPRRQELLRNAGIHCTVESADIDETPIAGEFPQQCAERLAREKALKISQREPRNFILGADTIVVVDDMILGKPLDADDAVRMLTLLSGRTHTVITGVCLIGPCAKRSQSTPTSENREVRISSASTLVTMCELSDEEIRAYVASGEPMDKAGAYGIQGLASRWIPRIEGDYSNVVGLPVARVYEMLKELGLLNVS